MRKMGVGLCVLLLMQSCAPLGVANPNYPQVVPGQSVQPVSAASKDTSADTVLLPEGCRLYGVTYGELQKVGSEQAQANCRQLDDQALGVGILGIGLLGFLIFGIWSIISAFVKVLSPS